MRNFYLILMMLFLGMPLQAAADKKVEIPKDEKWDKNDERENSSPKLYQDESNVYVYSEKQLDNLTIGITDMQGNVYHQEVTTVPACMYYAISRFRQGRIISASFKEVTMLSVHFRDNLKLKNYEKP